MNTAGGIASGVTPGEGPAPPHSVDSSCVAHHDAGGVTAGASDGLKSAGAFAGQHGPALKHGGGVSIVSGGGEKNPEASTGPGLGGVGLQRAPFVSPCVTW